MTGRAVRAGAVRRAGRVQAASDRLRTAVIAFAPSRWVLRDLGSECRPTGSVDDCCRCEVHGVTPSHARWSGRVGATGARDPGGRAVEVLMSDCCTPAAATRADGGLVRTCCTCSGPAPTPMR